MTSQSPDYEQIKVLLKEYELEEIFPILEPEIQPGIRFQLARESNSSSLIGKSHLGGNPDLPENFSWPKRNNRFLDFLMQVRLEEIKPLDVRELLPSKGLLSFFYDLEEQPWGYDPKNLDGYKVIFWESVDNLSPKPIPNEEYQIPLCSLTFTPCITVPHPFTNFIEDIRKEYKLSDEDRSNYWDFAEAVRQSSSPSEVAHQLLGNSLNVQNDMQLEAQLVMNGLYCGDESGYRSKRVKELAKGVKDWQLLLQLDSDDAADMMWGDCGMLYYWIRKEDLKACKFDQVWMTLQCS